MNPEVKQKWIDALRSGNYEQGSEKLRSVSGYCCLGVLCDLYAQEYNTEWKFKSYDDDTDEENPYTYDYWYFEEQTEFLPYSVMDWAGLKIPNPEVRIDKDVEGLDEDESLYQESLADLNDSGYTFNDLSKIIEQQL